MTTLKLNNKTDFINSFLSPIGKLTENTVIKVREKEFVSTSSSADGTLIVHCVYNQTNDVPETLFLNIPDINKLIKVLACIQEDQVDLSFNNNNIEHRSASVGFKYHLLEDGIIDPPSVDISKIKQIEFNTVFSVDQQTVNQLVKGSTFTTDTDKIYFHTQDGKVFATLTDRQRHNVDSFTQLVSENVKGDDLERELPIGFETIRIISSIRFTELKVHINTKLNVFLFQLICNDTNISIVSSGYVG